jgi:hypothetical protein
MRITRGYPIRRPRAGGAVVRPRDGNTERAKLLREWNVTGGRYLRRSGIQAFAAFHVFRTHSSVYHCFRILSARYHSKCHLVRGRRQKCHSKCHLAQWPNVKPLIHRLANRADDATPRLRLRWISTHATISNGRVRGTVFPLTLPPTIGRLFGHASPWCPTTEARCGPPSVAARFPLGRPCAMKQKPCP